MAAHLGGGAAIAVSAHCYVTMALFHVDVETHDEVVFAGSFLLQSDCQLRVPTTVANSAVNLMRADVSLLTNAVPRRRHWRR